MKKLLAALLLIAFTATASFAATVTHVASHAGLYTEVITLH